MSGKNAGPRPAKMGDMVRQKWGTTSGKMTGQSLHFCRVVVVRIQGVAFQKWKTWTPFLSNFNTNRPRVVSFLKHRSWFFEGRVLEKMKERTREKRRTAGGKMTGASAETYINRREVLETHQEKEQECMLST